MLFTVTLSAASTQAVSVQYATANGTATAGVDYTAATGTLTFAPGELTKTISVAVTGDTTVESDETLIVKLGTALAATILAGTGTGTIVNDDAVKAGTYNYADVLQKSLLFYDAQRSGDLPTNFPLNWRGDSALTDGKDVGVDLSGGYYDAGDHVKFALPMASSMTLLGLGVVQYRDAYVTSGLLPQMLDALKWGTDWLIKAHPSANVFYAQVGNGSADHAFWGAPEVMTMGRPAYKLDPTHPGSDAAGEAAAAADWASQVTLPQEERSKAVRLFNGRDLDGWEGHVDPYWSVDAGEIVVRNAEADAPKVSTNLLTKKPYRDFRLLCEGKLATSEMHSGVAIWGKKFDKDGEASSYQGHLVMFPSGWGLYDLFRRNGIAKDEGGRAKAAGLQHDWNRMEILAIGSRIRLAVNGKEVLDWTDPQPELCQPGPIGLQLHSNTVPQEVRFRGLVLVENPQDVLVTASPTP
jgi:hypothetical protein